MGIRPVKNWVVGCWRGYLSGARCRLAYGPADATATNCLLLQWNPDWFTFLVPAHLGSPGQRAVKRVCGCVCPSNAMIFNKLHYMTLLLFPCYMVSRLMYTVSLVCGHCVWEPTFLFRGVARFFVPNVTLIDLRVWHVPPWNLLILAIFGI